LWLDTTTVVEASLNKSGVVTDHVVTDHVMDICLRVGGFLKLSVSKDDALNSKSPQKIKKVILIPWPIAILAKM
jgi:hypothetical protein